MFIKRLPHLALPVLATWIALTASPAIANPVTIVAPGDLTNTEGNSNNCFPYICGAQRYQQVFDASHFGGTSGTIDKLLYRVDGGSTQTFSNIYDLEIRLSHTTTTPATLSTTFANNIGGDETLVLDDNAFVISGQGFGGAGPNPFNIVVDLINNFVYNGIDNLLLDIRLFSGGGGPQFDSSNRGINTDKMQRVWGNVNSTIGSIGGDEGLVTAFVLVPVDVPEPDTLLLLGLGLLGLGLGWRYKSSLKTR